MKTTKKSPSKTPIDVLRALEAARRAADEIALALAAIDPAAFPEGGTAAAQAALAGLVAEVARLEARRPLKKTERRAIEAAAVAAESVSPAQAEAAAGEDADTSFNFAA